MKILKQSLVVLFLTVILFVNSLSAQSAEFNALGLLDIQAINMSQNKINGSNNQNNQLTSGTIIAYKTNEGRYGKMQIKRYGYDLIIRCRTYNSNGSIYSQTNNLKIRGTFRCDLDSASESRISLDFWWEQATSVERYLTPRSGAEFAVYLRGSSEDNDTQFVGYVSDEEDRFVDYVWEFIDEFKNTWSNTQYYWGECRLLGADHLWFADSADLAYNAGHGSPSYISMSSGEGCTLTSRAWGSYSSNNRVGDLEYIVFHSCRVLVMDSNWRSRWRHYSSTQSQNRPFSGLHVALGFRTKHRNGLSAGPHTADDFAENLEDGYSVRRAWYVAAKDNRWRAFKENRNKPAIFYIRPHKYETISGHSNMDYRYGDPEYLLDAYYMK